VERSLSKPTDKEELAIQREMITHKISNSPGPGPEIKNLINGFRVELFWFMQVNLKVYPHLSIKK